MNSRLSRLARGWVTGTFATVVAAVLHVSAGGIAPSALAIGLGVVFSGLVGTAFAGRRPSLLRLGGAIALSQAAFHFGFSLLGAGGAVLAGGGHVHTASTALSVVSVPHGAHESGPLMWLAHLSAGALTIAFLFFAERSVWDLLSAGARAVIAVFRMPQLGSVGVRRVRQAVVDVSPRRLDVLAESLARRGPPVLGIS